MPCRVSERSQSSTRQGGKAKQADADETELERLERFQMGGKSENWSDRDRDPVLPIPVLPQAVELKQRPRTRIVNRLTTPKYTTNSME